MSQPQRRMFRGRGGPTDRRLPKFNARRRKPSAADNPPHAVVQENPVQEDSILEPSVAAIDVETPSSSSSTSQPLEVPDSESRESELVEATSAQHIGEEQEQQHLETSTISLASQETKALETEMRHLQKRIQNNREQFSLSGSGLATVESYQMNVLNAVSNCFNEWRGIARHYSVDGSNDALASMDPLLLRKMGQFLFELLQQALQTGPLAGGKPGYFKRCGSQVATVVHAFLCEVVANETEATTELHFTEKQAKVVESWKTASLSASERHAPPSKHVLQRQKEAKQQQDAKKELLEKKKKKRMKKQQQ